MSVLKQWLLGSCIFTLLFMLAPAIGASESDQKVVATFNVPVEIPGQILPSGTYVFKILDIWSNRNVVRVFNADESRVLATTIAIPRYRTNPTEDAVFVFEERGSNLPQALEAWFYPGRKYGHQFIYSARVTPEAATAISTVTPAPPSEAAANPPNVPSPEANVSEPPPEDLPQRSQVSDQNQTTQSQTTPNTSTTASGTSTDQADKELPKTASTTPLIALIGGLLLGGALGLKALASRVS